MSTVTSDTGNTSVGHCFSCFGDVGYDLFDTENLKERCCCYDGAADSSVG